jgi:hypothetical protein
MPVAMSRNVLSLLAALVFSAIVFPACNKEEPTVAVITVVNEDGVAVPGALVKLFAAPAFPLNDPNRLDKELTTDASGRAEFDYSDEYKQGQSGFAVMDIIATKDTLIGEGIIKILEEETNNETVILLPAQ